MFLSSLKSPQLLPNIIGGIVISLFTVIYAISFAAMIFSGDLSPYLSQGIGLILLSSIIVSSIISSLSSYPGVVATPQKTVASVLSLMAVTIVTSMPDNASDEQKFFTVVAAIMVNSICSGIFFYGLGYFKLGNLIRYIPYPVIGGFLAGSSWLLIQGSFRLMTEKSLTILQLSQLFEPELLLKWIPGVIFGILLWFLLKFYRYFWITPAMITIAILLFYTILMFNKIPIETVNEKGFLLGPFNSNSLYSFVSFDAFNQANWGVIFNNMISLIVIWLINGIALLLNNSGIEIVAQRDIELNHELKTAGIATLISGFGGGIGGFHSLKLSSLAYVLGAKSRLIGWIMAGICTFFLIIGADVLSIIPKMLIGGMLIFLGLELWMEWIYFAWFRLSRSDYFTVVIIWLIISIKGYLTGILIGTLIATVIFVINYSRLEVIKYNLSRANHQSNVTRNPEEESYLQERGEEIQIFVLQGYIFFGIAHKLLQQLEAKIINVDPPVNFAIIDFKHVNDLDISALKSFVKLKQIATKNDLKIIFTSLTPKNIQKLKEENCLTEKDSTCQVFLDLDKGLEWCEEQMLIESQIKEDFIPLNEQLIQFFPNINNVDKFMEYLTPINLKENEYLFRQGEKSDGFYFIENGQVSIILELENNQQKRLRSYKSGNTIGEMGLYLQAPRSASIVADKNSNLYHLSQEQFKQLEIENSLLAIDLHKFIVNLLATRLQNSNKEIYNLLK